MKSRRPPLILTEPKSQQGAEAARRQDEAVQATGANLTAPEPEPEPEYEPLEPIELGIPGAGISIAPPPEAAPPVHTRPADLAESATEARPVPRPTAQAAPASTTVPGWLYWGLVTVASLMWGSGLIAFVLGAQSDIRAFNMAPFQLAVLAVLAIFPIGLVFAGAFALRHAAALAQQARRAQELADTMVGPATAAAAQTGDLVEALRAQIDQAVRAVRLAHADIAELSSRLRSETEQLNDAALMARTAAQTVTRTFEQERLSMGRVSDSLETQARGVVEAVERQARMVSDASELAQSQLSEAESLLRASTTSLVTATSEVQSTAVTVSGDLDRQTERLETAGQSVVGQIRALEDNLSQQRAGLVSTALSLRADQEDFAVHIENLRAQLTEALSITRVATVDLGETSSRGVEVMRDVLLAAQEQFRSLLGAAENERTAFETRIHSTLSNISLMAADARDDLVNETRRSLEHLQSASTEAKKAADAAALSAQSRVDRLNESLFEVGKKADEVFDVRFNAARRLIEDSAELIVEAGDETIEKLDVSFARTRDMIAQVSETLGELSRSADQLPLLAQERLNDIRRSVEEGLTAMTQAARKATLESEALDTAFQDRVRRNYDMLSEAVRLMGVISGEASPNLRPQPVPQPAPQSPVTRDSERLRLSQPMTETRRSPGPAVRADPLREPPTARPSVQTYTPAPTPPSATSPASAPAPSVTPSPARPQAQPGTRPSGEPWSWRDLLSGMDGELQTRAEADALAAQAGHDLPPPDPEFDRIDAVMVREVAALGVDAASVLTRPRIDELISAIMTEDNDGARQLVRRLAPAAVRRLGRRLSSDPGLREQVADYLAATDRQINVALMSRHPERALHEVLSHDAGRAYLLLDAALSDLV